MRQILVIFMLLFSSPAFAAPIISPQVKSYSEIVYKSYQSTYSNALQMQKSISAFLENPSDETRQAAQISWLALRGSYAETEAFRFYDGPADQKQLTLNQYPIQTSFIDNLLADQKFSINPESLLARNQEFDETQVTTGLNVIEYFLWKKEFKNEREKQYLKTITNLAVADIKFLQDSWEPAKPNYAREFLAAEPAQSLEQIMLGITVLSGFELASHRLEVNNNTYSKTSQNTKQEMLDALKGIRKVYFGAGINSLVEEKEKTLADKISVQMLRSEQLAAAPLNSEALKRALIDSLQIQAGLFKQAAQKLELNLGNVAE